MGALYSAVVPALDLVKKWYEIRKLRFELREKEAAERLIQLPTPDEIRKLGKMTAEKLIVEETVMSARVVDEVGRDLPW